MVTQNLSIPISISHFGRKCPICKDFALKIVKILLKIEVFKTSLMPLSGKKTKFNIFALPECIFTTTTTTMTTAPCKIILGSQVFQIRQVTFPGFGKGIYEERG